MNKMASQTEMDRRITNSQISTMKQCQHKHWLQYVVGLRKQEQSSALMIGSAIHLGLDLAAQGVEENDLYEQVDEYLYQQKPDDPEKEYWWAIDREKVRRLLSGYFWWWARDDKNVRMVATELQFEVPIKIPGSENSYMRLFKLAGKIDKLINVMNITDSNDVVFVREHKTTLQDITPTSDYWKRLRIDSQISIYCIAAKAIGHDIHGVQYDVIRKPRIRPSQVPLLDDDGVKQVVDAAGNRVYKADGKPRLSADSKLGYTLLTRMETPEEYGDRITEDIGHNPESYFARQEVGRTEQNLIDAELEIYQWAKMLREAEKLNRWPRNDKACIGFGKCPYFDICTSGGIDPDDVVVPEGFIVVENKHSELDDGE